MKSECGLKNKVSTICNTSIIVAVFISLAPPGKTSFATYVIGIQIASFNTDV